MGTRPERDARLARVGRELEVALRSANSSDLRAWGVRSLARFPQSAGRRVKRIGRLLKTITVGAVGEIVDAGANRNRLGDHLRERGDVAIGVGASALQAGAEAAAEYGGLVKRLATEPTSAAPILVGSIAGFLIGSGGLNADGGLPDLDIDLIGIGSHRSILTHSILVGASAEAIIFGTLDLALVVYDGLPPERDPLWDEIVGAAAIFADATRRGTDAGLAWHIGADATVDGFTPYKDLPISLPESGHRLLMGLNALGEADAAFQVLESKNPGAARLARLLLRTT